LHLWYRIFETDFSSNSDSNASAILARYNLLLIFSALIFSIFMLKISIQYFVTFCNIYKSFIKDNSIIFVTLNILNFDFFSDNTANDNPRNDTFNVFPFFPFISPVFLFNVLQHLVTHNTCNISLYFITLEAFSHACRYRIFQTT